MTYIERFRERLKNHLLQYKDQRDWTQEQMAAHIGVKYRTYQDIEKSGNAKKADALIKIIEKTDFECTQKVADSEDISDIKLALKFLTERAIETEKKITNKPDSEIRKEFHTTMKEVYGLSLEEFEK